VICHLGAGASATGLSGGRSADTTMGFTPLEGLVMATRCGDLGPGALLFALDHGLHLSEATEDLEHRSGLLGISGTTGDMRQLSPPGRLATSRLSWRSRSTCIACGPRLPGWRRRPQGPTPWSSPAGSARARELSGPRRVRPRLDGGHPRSEANNAVGAADAEISAPR
jgi:hypothetical protein